MAGTDILTLHHQHQHQHHHQYHHHCHHDDDNEHHLENDNIPEPGASLQSSVFGEQGNHQIQFQDVYEIHDELCSGSFGTVYTGQHVNNIDNDIDDDNNAAHVVAIKVINRRRHSTEDVLQEVSIMRDLSYVQQTPNVVQLIDFYMDESNMYVVQNLASGGDVLDQLMCREIYCEDDARNLTYVLLSVIDTLHNDHTMCHRDIKPENLLLQNADDDSSLMLCDFGYATYMPNNANGDDPLATFAGTLAYMAPEIVLEQPYDGKAVDMWSIGCSLFILLGGYQAFEDNCEVKTIEHIVNCDYGGFDNEPAWDAISDEAKELIANLLVADPKHRWDTKQALQCNWFQANDDGDDNEGFLLDVHYEEGEENDSDDSEDDYFDHSCNDKYSNNDEIDDPTEFSMSAFEVFNPIGSTEGNDNNNDHKRKKQAKRINGMHGSMMASSKLFDASNGCSKMFDRSMHLHTTFRKLRKYCTKRKLKAAVHAVTFSKLLQMSIHEKDEEENIDTTTDNDENENSSTTSSF